MTTMKKFAAALAATSVLALSACGGGGRPSVDDLVDALSGADNVFGTELEKKQAECVAEKLHASDVSDDTLRAIVDGDEDYEGSSDEGSKLATAMTEATDCLTE